MGKSKKPKGDPDSEPEPSLALLRFYVRMLAVVAKKKAVRKRAWEHDEPQEPRPSVRSIATEMGVTHVTVLNNLGALQRYFGKSLIDTGTFDTTELGERVGQWAINVLRLYDTGSADLSGRKPNPDPTSSSPEAG